MQNSPGESQTVLVNSMCKVVAEFSRGILSLHRWPSKTREPNCVRSSGLELSVTFDKLFRAATGEAHGQAAVFVIALDAHDGSNAEAWMTDFASEQGIGIAAALRCGTSEGILKRLTSRRRFGCFECASNV